MAVIAYQYRGDLWIGSTGTYRGNGSAQAGSFGSSVIGASYVCPLSAKPFRRSRGRKRCAGHYGITPAGTGRHLFSHNGEPFHKGRGEHPAQGRSLPDQLCCGSEYPCMSAEDALKIAGIPGRPSTATAPEARRYVITARHLGVFGGYTALEHLVSSVSSRCSLKCAA